MTEDCAVKDHVSHVDPSFSRHISGEVRKNSQKIWIVNDNESFLIKIHRVH